MEILGHNVVWKAWIFYGIILTVIILGVIYLPHNEYSAIPESSSTNFTVTFYNCNFGLTEHSCYDDIQNLEGVGRVFNLSFLFFNTSYSANLTEIKAVYEKKIMLREFPVYGMITINETRYNYSEFNLTGVITNYTYSYTTPIQTGTEIKNITEWKDMTGKIVEKNADRVKHNFGQINIPKFNSKATVDDFGNIETINGTKTFLIIWTTPIVKSESGWGSSGQIVIVDENTGGKYE